MESKTDNTSLAGIDLKERTAIQLRRLCNERGLQVGMRAQSRTCIRELNAWQILQYPPPPLRHLGDSYLKYKTSMQEQQLNAHELGLHWNDVVKYSMRNKWKINYTLLDLMTFDPRVQRNHPPRIRAGLPGNQNPPRRLNMGDMFPGVRPSAEEKAKTNRYLQDTIAANVQFEEEQEDERDGGALNDPQQQPELNENVERTNFMRSNFQKLLTGSFDKGTFLKALPSSPSAAHCPQAMDLLLEFQSSGQSEKASFNKNLASHCYHLQTQTILLAFYDGTTIELGKRLAHCNNDVGVSWDVLYEALVLELRYTPYHSLFLSAKALAEGHCRGGITKSRWVHEVLAGLHPNEYVGAWKIKGTGNWNATAFEEGKSKSTINFGSPFFWVRTISYNAALAAWSVWAGVPEMLLVFVFSFHLAACYFAVVHTQMSLHCYEQEGKVLFYDHLQNLFTANKEFLTHHQRVFDLQLHTIDVSKEPINNIYAIRVCSEPLRLSLELNAVNVHACGSYPRALARAWFLLALSIMKTQMGEFDGDRRFAVDEAVWCKERDRLAIAVRLFEEHGLRICLKIAKDVLAGRRGPLMRGLTAQFFRLGDSEA